MTDSNLEHLAETIKTIRGLSNRVIVNYYTLQRLIEYLDVVEVADDSLPLKGKFVKKP